MAQITNQANLSFRYGNATGSAVSNIATATLLDPLSVEKTSVDVTYRADDRLTYVLSLQNNGDVVEAHQGDSVHQAGVVGIKGDDVLHAHGLQLLQGNGAVQGLADDAAVLTAAVQGGHDDAHAVAAAGDGLDQTLQVGEVIVGGHVVVVIEELVGHGVVAGITDEENIVTADGLLHETLGVAALETGAGALDDEGILLDADFLGPCDQVVVDELGQLLSAGAGDQSRMGDLSLRAEKFGRGDGFDGHIDNSSILMLRFITRLIKCSAKG